MPIKFFTIVIYLSAMQIHAHPNILNLGCVNHYFDLICANSNSRYRKGINPAVFVSFPSIISQWHQLFFSVYKQNVPPHCVGN